MTHTIKEINTHAMSDDFDVFMVINIWVHRTCHRETIRHKESAWHGREIEGDLYLPVLYSRSYSIVLPAVITPCPYLYLLPLLYVLPALPACRAAVLPLWAGACRAMPCRAALPCCCCCCSAGCCDKYVHENMVIVVLWAYMIHVR